MFIPFKGNVKDAIKYKASRGLGALGVPGAGAYAAGQDKKRGLARANESLDELTGKVVGIGNASAERQRREYDPASKHLDGYKGPSYLQDMAGKPTSQQSRYQNAPKPTRTVRDYYGGMSLGAGAAGSLYNQRKTQGYGPNLVKEATTARPFKETSRLGNFAAGLGTNRTNTEDRLHGGGRSPLDALDSRLEARKAELNRTTGGQNWSTATNPADFTRGSEGFGKRLAGTTIDKNTGNFFDSLKTSESAALNQELQGPFESEAAKRQKLIAGGGGDSGKFLQGLDASGLGRSARGLENEGPTYEEEFYTSQRDQENPQYKMLQDDLSQRLQRESAARGQFVSGNALDLAMRGSARLGAEEFANRGQLAQNAGEARRARLGQQLEGASALEGLRGSTALARDSMGNELSTSADGANQARMNLRGDVIGRRESLMGDLSMKRDDLGVEKLGMDGTNSRFGDTQRAQLSDMQLRAAGMDDDVRTARNQGLDNVSQNLSARDQNRRDQDDHLASAADQERRASLKLLGDTYGQADAADDARWNNNLDALGTAQNFDVTNQRALDDFGFRENDLGLRGAQAAGGEEERGEEAIDNRAQGADASTLAVNQAASQEYRQNFTQKFEGMLRIGDVKAALEHIRSGIEIGAITQADLTKIQNDLIESGVDSAVAAEMGAGIQRMAKAAIDYKTGGAAGLATGGFGQAPQPQGRG